MIDTNPQAMQTAKTTSRPIAGLLLLSHDKSERRGWRFFFILFGFELFAD